MYYSNNITITYNENVNLCFNYLNIYYIEQLFKVQEIKGFSFKILVA
jgi:hypothetical protein